MICMQYDLTYFIFYHTFTLLKVCTILTQRALEDIKRCKDPQEVAAGQCLKRTYTVPQK